jgi:hypothetical protein
MVRVDVARWGQTVDDLRAASLAAPHRRSRERFQALWLIASGHFNATTCAFHIGRSDDTVLARVHLYNAQGPDALSYKKTGGRAPLLRHSRPSRSSAPSRTASPSSMGSPVTSGRSRSSAPTC